MTRLTADYTSIYIVDLGGDVRKNPKLSGTTHNVFGIQVGVSVNIFVRKQATQGCQIWYAQSGEDWRKEQKLELLDQFGTYSSVTWQQLHPDPSGNWLTDDLRPEFKTLLAVGGKKGQGIFSTFGLGVSTNRDAWAYNFNTEILAANVKKTIGFYNQEILRWRQAGRPKDVDTFVQNDDNDHQIGWSRDLKADLRRERFAEFSQHKIRTSLYRPFTEKHLFLDRILNEEVYQFPNFLPTTESEGENRVLCSPSAGARADYWIIASAKIPNLALTSIDAAQCFPFYTYDEDGSNRRENITDWALEEFRQHYNDPSITKWDIFHYTYALLHSPEYRQRYAANLKRELPRIPYDPEFRAFATTGKRLAELHVN